jgi:glycosyltransferase involved in cell wall biosynthesis
MTEIAILPIMSGRGAGGPETYERGLVHGIAAQDRETRYRVLALNAAAVGVLSPAAPNFSAEILPGRFRAIQLTAGLHRAIGRSRPDLMHAAFVAPPRSPVPYVFTLHCSSTFMRPDLFPTLIRWRLLYLFRRGMMDARRVICVSQNVKDYAVQHYRVDPDRLSVVHNGVGAHFRPVPQAEAAPVLRRYGLPERYVFCAARFEKRKNLPGALRAFAAYRRHDPECRIVLAGDMYHQRDRMAALAESLGIADAVVMPGYIPNEDLPAVYSHCLFFAYPSIWEGFGIPLLEAMACGAPVLSSAVTSIPEVAGDAALLVDPLSDAEMAAGFLRLGTEPELRARLAAAGPLQAARFSWERCAAETIAVYRACL